LSDYQRLRIEYTSILKGPYYPLSIGVSKSISSTHTLCEYAKEFSHIQVLVTNFFSKEKLGLEVSGRLLIAIQ
jgi:hypothetical protein